MAKFIFKLQTLLKVKIQMEDNLKNDLGKAIQKFEEEKAKLRRLEFEKSRYIMEFNEKSRKTTVNNLIKFNNYISFLAVKILNQKENINLASRNVDKIREELIKIVKEREILDKLKEKKYGVFQKELLKDEQR
ncbi:MAG: flagellar export protein FliJ, partial [Clostridiales bacterium GWC2_40_7]